MRRIQLLACTGLLTALGLPVLAQSPAAPAAATTRAEVDDTTVEAIVVTARKREELLEDVPAAITAFGKNDIARYGLNSVDELTRLTPGLQTAESSVSSGGSISLRGVGSGSTNYLGDQAVSINVDGMQVGTLNIRKTAQIDLAQIEVLRGPQALFFGKNSPGGVISLKTADPGSREEIEVSTGLEAVSQDYYVQALYSAPLSDRVGLRVVGRYSKMNGYFNVKTVPANGDPLVIPAHVDKYPVGDELFFRTTLIVEPTDNLKINSKFTYNKSDVEGGSITTLQRISCPNGAPQLQPAFPCVGDRDIYRGGAPAIVAQLVPGSPTVNGLGLRNNEQVLATVQADYKITPNLTATSVTGYYWFDEINAHNASIGPRATLLVPYLPFEMKQFTQELRLASSFEGPLNVTLGAFYESRTADGAQDAVILTGPAPFAIGTERTHQSQDAYSLFGQLIWTPTDRLEVSGGLRYSHERKDLRFFHRGIDVTANLATDELKFSNVSPELTVSYDLTEELMVFGSYKEGFKSGGFDAGFTNGAIGRARPGAFNNTFAEEHVSGFEGGVKGNFARRLTFGVTAYAYDYTDLQVGAFDAASISFKVLNAAAAEVQGVELELDWQTPINGLSLRGSAAYNDAKFKDFLSGCYLGQTPALGCNKTLNPATGAFLEQDMAGRRMNNAPKVVMFGGFLYTRALTQGLDLEFTLDAEHSSAYFANLRQSPQDLQDAFTKINAGVRLFGPDRKWEFALLARNLTNEYIFAASGPVTLTGSGSGTPTARFGDESAAITRGREVFLRAAYRF